MYSCEKCRKEFFQKCDYTAHDNKKNPCRGVEARIDQLVNKTVKKELRTQRIYGARVDIYANNSLGDPKSNPARGTDNPTHRTGTPAHREDKPVIPAPPVKKKFIDLFAGTGGFSHALEKCGKFESIFANDMVEPSKKIYMLNNPDSNFVLEDLNLIDVKTIPAHNILCGGFPCQPFSIAGKKKGFDDKRSNVFWKILEILDHHKPEIVVLENVKNLKSHDKGNTYMTIIDKLTEKGYHIKSKILDTTGLTGIPHHRERIYIVCFRDKKLYKQFDFDFPKIDCKPIRNFLEPNPDKKYYYTPKLKVYDTVKKSVVKNISENVIYQYRRFYMRENKSGHCPTLTANMGGGGHNVPILLDDGGIRKLTPRECFNLQGFPADYKLPKISDSALYKLAGNAISVPVVELIANKISSILPD
jgi:DNA (cytosine-5)-methyltransferase 1